MRRLAFLLPLLLVTVSAVAEATPGPTQEELYAPRFLALGMRDMTPLLACYQARPDEADRAFERLRSVSVRVKPDGSLGRITISPASAVTPELKSCFLDVARSWTVTPPSNGRELRLRFTKAHFF